MGGFSLSFLHASLFSFLSLAATSGLPPSLRFLPDGHLSEPDVSLVLGWVSTLSRIPLIEPSFSRHRGSQSSSSTSLGVKLVLPPAERRVPVVAGFRAHFNAAALLPFPFDSRLRPSSLQPHLQKAIRLAVQNSSLPELRRANARTLRLAAIELRPVSARINELMPSTVFQISSGVNTAFMAVAIDAVGWLDVSLVRNFVRGFHVVGPIPDSYVYRLIQARSNADAVAAYQAFLSTARAWNRVAHRRISFSRWASSDALTEAAAGTAATAKERGRGVVVGPYATVDALHGALARRFPHLSPSAVYPRVMVRFTVLQKGKHRAIDDGKSNGANAATTLRETVTTPSFLFPAIVARASRAAALAAGVQPPGLTSALADLTMAYRTIPSSQPWLTCFGHLDTGRTPPAPSYYFLPGHNFGLTSSVVNFNRYAETVAVLSSVYGGVVADHYYDDFIVVDTVAGGSSAFDFLHDLVLDLGIGRPRARREVISSPELDPEKDQVPAFKNSILGVEVDLSEAASRGLVHAHVSPSRASSIKSFIEDCYLRNRFRGTDSAHLRGRLGFALSPALAGFGRAATLPLVHRQYHELRTDIPPGSELNHSLHFFLVILPYLPSLRLTLSTADSTEPPLLVYTDASFWWKRTVRVSGLRECADERSRRRPMGDMGAVVYDPVTGKYKVAAATPPWHLYKELLPTKKTHIAFLEALAVLCVYSTYPDLFRGRQVTHWVDNSVALSAYVHGYSGKVELAKTVNAFYLQAAGLGTSVFFDYVPSKANIADLPSRGASWQVPLHLRGFLLDSSVPDSLVVPDMATWHGPLHHWIEHILSSHSPRS